MADDPVPNDASIADDTVLWRRVRTDQVVTDENPGQLRKRASSVAFSMSSDGSGISVVIATEGRNPNEILQSNPGDYVVALTVGFVRSLKLGVIREPLPDEPHHAEIVGDVRKPARSALAKNAVWIIGPA